MDLKTWTHVAVTSTGSAVIIYLNGAPVAARSVLIATQAGPMSPGGMGLTPDGTRHRFAGMLDDVTLYNRALTAPEIAGIYAAGQAGKCR